MNWQRFERERRRRGTLAQTDIRFTLLASFRDSTLLLLETANCSSRSFFVMIRRRSLVITMTIAFFPSFLLTPFCLVLVCSSPSSFLFLKRRTNAVSTFLLVFSLFVGIFFCVCPFSVCLCLSAILVVLFLFWLVGLYASVLHRTSSLPPFLPSHHVVILYHCLCLSAILVFLFPFFVGMVRSIFQPGCMHPLLSSSHLPLFSSSLSFVCLSLCLSFCLLPFFVVRVHLIFQPGCMRPFFIALLKRSH